jgi:hypothetical protein
LRLTYLSISSLLFINFPKLKFLESNYLKIESEEAVKEFFSRNLGVEEIKINQILGIRTAKTGGFLVKSILQNLHFLTNLKFFHLKSVMELRGNLLGVRFENVENFSISVKIDKRGEDRIFEVDNGAVDHYQEIVQSLWVSPLCQDCRLERIDYHW